jgi:hypothetical protein
MVRGAHAGSGVGRPGERYPASPGYPLTGPGDRLGEDEIGLALEP